jgi:hypothetical protein
MKLESPSSSTDVDVGGGKMTTQVSDGQTTDDGKHKISSSVDFLAGGLVSAISKIAVYPMETKVMLVALGQKAPDDPMRMWHGVVIKAAENFLYNGLLWFLKERIRPPPSDPSQPEKRPPATFISAFAVTCFCNLMSHPLSNTVAGMQASLKNEKQLPASAFKVASSILEERGLGGFFKGWQLSVALRVGSAVTLVVYDFVRLRLAGLVGSDSANFLAGLLGRLGEVLLTHPIKTLRARQQQGQSLLISLNVSSITGLWAGVGTMAFADAVKIGLRFGLIERVRIVLQWLLDRRRPAQKRVKDDEEENTDAKKVMGA